MAGSPRKRQRKAEAAAAEAGQFGLNREELDAIAAGHVPPLGEIPDAVSAPPGHARAHYARARPAAAPGATRPQAPPFRAGSPGPTVRAFADNAEAVQIARLASALRAAVCVRIERKAPHWAAGWLEDYQLETDGIGELLQYLRDEYGGQKYSIQAISAAGQPIYTAGLTIAGPVRAAGRVTDRETWEHGNGSRPAAPAVVAAPAAHSDITDMVKLVLSEARESRNATLDAVRETTDRSQKAIEGLLKTIVTAREAAAQTASLPEQLGALVRNVGAIQTVGDALRPPTEAAPAAAEPDDPNAVLSKAVNASLANMITSAVFKQPGAPGAPAGGPFPPGMATSGPPGFMPPGAPGAPAGGPIPEARKVKPD